jgi:hypothetical protein
MMNTISDPDDEDKDIKPRLDALAPTEIIHFGGNDNLAVVTIQVAAVTEIEVRHLSSPPRLQSCYFVIALIQFLNSEKTRSGTPRHSYHALIRIKRFFEWANKKYPNSNELPEGVMQDYLGYLREMDIQLNSIAQYMGTFRLVLDWAIDEYNKDPQNEQKTKKLRKVRSYIPAVSSRSGKPKKSLSQITDLTIKDELKLIRSTIRFTCHFLKTMNNQRKLLLGHSSVRSQLQKLITDCKGDYSQLRFCCAITKRSTIYKPLADAIYSSDDLGLKERLLSNSTNFVNNQMEQDDEICISEANKKIKAGLRESGCLDIQPDNLDDKLDFQSIDYLFLIKHTPAEETCFAWLLGTDRVQLSGALEMRLSDIAITATSASPSYTKERSSKHDRSVPMHGRKSLHYRAYEEYLNLKKEFLEKFPEHGDKLFDLPQSGTFQILDSRNYRPIVLFSMPHTRLYSDLYDADNEIAPFAKIIERVALFNENHHDAHNARYHNKKAGKPAKPIKLPRRQSITMNIIAQSRAILDENHIGSVQEGFDQYSQEIIDADATAHSPNVKRIQYIHASETKYRIDKRANFAAAVGALMVEDARKVQKYLCTNQFITVDELKIMLGWSPQIHSEDDVHEFDNLLISAQKAGWRITPFGQLEMGDRAIIVVNAVTAALLIGYKEECINEISRLTIEDASKAAALLMQAAQIDGSLEKFDATTIAEGKKIITQYDFPNPVMR